MPLAATVPPPALTQLDVLWSRIQPSRWLANRSFVAKDGTGHVIFGTIADAFFSLGRLAEFLRAAPLDLKIALNLDGGPVACQGIKLNGYRRDFCGDWEMKTDGGELRLLRRLNRQSALGIADRDRSDAGVECALAQHSKQSA